MNDPEVCDRYARALIGLAEQRSELDSIENALANVCEIFLTHPEAARIIDSPAVSHADKDDLIDQISKGPSKLLTDFLKVLIHKNHFEDLAGVRDEYHRLFEKKKGLLEIRVITAVAIPESVRNRIATVCKNKWRSEVRLICERNPKILGGIILRFDGKEIDACYQTRLAEIRQQLMV